MLCCVVLSLHCCLVGIALRRCRYWLSLGGAPTGLRFSAENRCVATVGAPHGIAVWAPQLSVVLLALPGVHWLAPQPVAVVRLHGVACDGHPQVHVARCAVPRCCGLTVRLAVRCCAASVRCGPALSATVLSAVSPGVSPGLPGFLLYSGWLLALPLRPFCCCCSVV